MILEPKIKQPLLSSEMQNIINRSHGDTTGSYYDDTDRYKYLIMKILTNDQDILHTLNNEELEQINTDSDGIINGDAYRNINIYNFLKIPGIQSTTKNFICFEVDDVEQPRHSDHLIKKHIIFRTVSHEEDYQTDWGIARQDLLAAIIKSKFDWSNIFGIHLELVYNKGRVAENGYYYREMIYETTVPNNLANQYKNGGVSKYE